MWQQLLTCTKFEGEKFKKGQVALGVERLVDIEIDGQLVHFSTVPAPEDDLIAGYRYLRSPVTTPAATPPILNRNQIYRLMVQFQERALLYKDIAISHSAALAFEKEIGVFAEDLSQINALYRVIGEWKTQKTPAYPILMVSGKIDAELLNAAIQIGAKALISRLAPTDQAYHLAIANDILLVGFARGARFTVYNGKVN